jgi:uncharacterized RDD family membrane protein YckC
MDAASGSQTLYCAECGRPSTADELARFGNLMICPACKSSYTQKLREGAAQPAAAAYAGFWMRVLAYLIDGIIVGVLAGILQVALGASLLNIPRAARHRARSRRLRSHDGNDRPHLAHPDRHVFLLYEAFFVAHLSATPGKLVLGLKVLRPDGSRVALGRAFGRYFAKMLSALALLIGFIMVAFDSQKRGLHDMICDTRVVKARS